MTGNVCVTPIMVHHYVTNYMIHSAFIGEIKIVYCKLKLVNLRYLIFHTSPLNHYLDSETKKIIVTFIL